MASREDNIYYARLAEQGERYEDMIRYMKEVCKVTIILSLYFTLFLLIFVSICLNLMIKLIMCLFCEIGWIGIG